MEDDDEFVRGYDDSELEIAAEFLTNWLPFLTRGLCADCLSSLRRRIDSIRPRSIESCTSTGSPSLDPTPAIPPRDSNEPTGLDSESWRSIGSPSLDPTPSIPPRDSIEPTGWDSKPVEEPSTQVRLSWADMAVQDELEEEEALTKRSAWEEKSDDGEVLGGPKPKAKLSRDQREYLRFKNVGRKKDFLCLERVRGKIVNVLDGLELHTGIFSSVEQKRIVDFVYELQEKGRKGQLRERTYSEPQKWMRGKGRVTIQFGCCYNYATDKNGNPPGIIRDVISDPLPQLFKTIIKRLVRWHVVPPSSVPDSCIVNIYEPGDCIPPHIDSHDFVRPFTTVSFLSECKILFGSDLKIEGPGEFSGSFAIPLPVGSVLVINGNGADVAKHCVPAVPTKRISITFRKMDASKRPSDFVPEPDLQKLEPLSYGLNSEAGVEPQLPPSSTRSSFDAKRDKQRGKKSNRKHFVSGSKHGGYQEYQEFDYGSGSRASDESSENSWGRSSYQQGISGINVQSFNGRRVRASFHGT